MKENMKEKKEQIKFNNSLLSGADGGTAFTAVSIVSLMVSLVYSFAVVAAGDGGTAFSQSKFGTFLSYFLSSFGLILSVAYITIKGKFSIKSVCRINAFEGKYVWLSLLVAFGALFGLSWLNTAFIDLLGHFGYTASVPNIPKDGFFDFVLCVIFICALPAVFEEIMFRGFILSATKRLGTCFAVITGGVLFSLFHKNPAQTPYQFVTGALFCLLAIKSGSIIPSVLVHFINNLYIIVLYFVAPSDFAFPAWLEISLGIIAICALVFSVYYLIKKCDQPEVEQKITQKYLEIFDKTEQRKQFFIFASGGIVLCAAIWFMGLIPQ